MSISYSAPSRLLELADWDALPDDEFHHVELVEGVLRVSPRPQFRHQDVLGRIYRVLSARLPPRWTALIEVEIVVEGDPFPTVRVPDVVVVPAGIATSAVQTWRWNGVPPRRHLIALSEPSSPSK